MLILVINYPADSWGVIYLVHNVWRSHTFLLYCHVRIADLVETGISVIHQN